MRGPALPIRLSAKQLAYLRKRSFFPDDLHGVLSTAEPTGHNTYSLAIHPDEAEALRNALTEHLASVGFDRSYELTSEGRVLEELIDALLPR